MNLHDSTLQQNKDMIEKKKMHWFCKLKPKLKSKDHQNFSLKFFLFSSFLSLLPIRPELDNKSWGQERYFVRTLFLDKQ